MKLFGDSDRDSYAVIGVGYFGSSVASALAEAGKSVIVLDSNPQKLRALSSSVSAVFQTDAKTKEALQEAGVGGCSTAIVAIGENLEASILITLNCIDLGIPRVICKAGSPEHGKILEKLGAEVIYPETEAGKRLAVSIMSKVNIDTLPLSDTFSIISVDVNPNFEGKTVVDLNWRKKYNINVVAVIRDGQADGT
ncbi:MAG: TrkA family potassium uptake protein, partial [Spirochaetales bacterium]|nr:TrkA family potassium uptake protein [Candidatus Physcosoma equi]